MTSADDELEETVAAHFVHTHTGHLREEAVGVSHASHHCCHWAGELPCLWRGALCGCAAALGGAWPYGGSWSRSL